MASFSFQLMCRSKSVVLPFLTLLNVKKGMFSDFLQPCGLCEPVWGMQTLPPCYHSSQIRARKIQEIITWGDSGVSPWAECVVIKHHHWPLLCRRTSRHRDRSSTVIWSDHESMKRIQWPLSQCNVCESMCVYHRCVCVCPQKELQDKQMELEKTVTSAENYINKLQSCILSVEVHLASIFTHSAAQEVASQRSCPCHWICNLVHCRWIIVLLSDTFINPMKLRCAAVCPTDMLNN